MQFFGNTKDLFAKRDSNLIFYVSFGLWIAYEMGDFTSEIIFETDNLESTIF